MKTLGMLLFLTIAVAGSGVGHTFRKDSTAGTCLIGGRTFACHNASTELNALEAMILATVLVRGIFVGPDYHQDKRHSQDVVWFLPRTWAARVTHAQCAYAGPHSASGYHWFEGDVGGMKWPTWPEETFGIFFQWACDCDGEIY
jgi:hypothetical protein